METSTSLVFIFFLLLLGLGIYFFHREVRKPSPRYFVTAIFVFCGLNLLGLFACILTFDPGLDIFFYLFTVTGSLLLSWLAAITITLGQYSTDKNKEKLSANIASSFILIFAIVFIWAFVNASGPMKFWG